MRRSPLDSGTLLSRTQREVKAMTTTYTVKLIREGNKQSLIIPQEFILSTTEFTLRQEDNKLILEPISKVSLLE